MAAAEAAKTAATTPSPSLSSCRHAHGSGHGSRNDLDVADDLDVNLKEEKETKCVGEGVGTKQVCQHLCYVPLLLLVEPNVILVSCSIVVILNVIPVLCPIIIIVSSLKEALYLMTHRNRPHKIFTWPAMHISNATNNLHPHHIETPTKVVRRT